tara:strand:- start:462 stop:890 length:429 start_codon:yes stop_codon:yes gene_type:complete
MLCNISSGVKYRDTLTNLPRISLFNQKNMSSNNRESLDETFLGRDASFKGELSFGGTLCIDGKFEGQISTNGTLIISKTGEIEANIEAETVICEGLVKGNIVASKRVELRPNSNIVGNIQSPSLNIEVGAKLDGKCDMTHTK